MPPFSHLVFSHAQPQAVRTLYCQLMLERGYLDNGNFYATCAHTPALLDRYAEVVGGRIRARRGRCSRRTRDGRAQGPVAHTGFARLTSG